MAADKDTEVIYQVVVNGEEQFSIWPHDRQIPEGWRGVGVAGAKETCLAHIEKVWTDMRPLSLRRHMAQRAENTRLDE